MGCLSRTCSAVLVAVGFPIIGVEPAWAAGPEPTAPPPVDEPPPVEPAVSPPPDPIGADDAAAPVADSEPDVPIADPPAAPSQPPAVAAEPAPEPAAETAPAEDEPAPPEPPPTKWYDAFTIGAFVDAYASFNANLPIGQSGTNGFRAFDASNGFSLAWAGVDLTYETKRAAAVVQLRMGTGVNAGWQDPAVPGIQHIKQAYARWKVNDKLYFDFGRWDSMYGVEVPESWRNHNYTHGFLYTLGQPFWHTGLRMGAQPLPSLGLSLVVVNGWHLIVDNNRGKSVGAQIAFTPGKVFKLYAGYLTGPESNELDPETEDRIRGTNREFRHLADVVARADWKKLSLIVNGDYIYDGRPGVLGDDVTWWGVAGSLQYSFIEQFAAAVRGEFVADPDGALTGQDALLSSATLTLQVRPVEPLILRLEGRYDNSNRSLFPKGLESTSPHQGTVTLGVVVTSF